MPLTNRLIFSNNSGNVGIGTTSPVSNSGYGGLTLNGTNGALFSLMTNGTESGRLASLGDVISIQSKATTGYITFVQGVSGGTERARIDASGNLLVGTTNPAILGRVSVSGSYYGLGEIGAYDASKQLIRTRMDSGVARLEATFFSGSGGGYVPLAFSTSDAERMRITSGGNIEFGYNSTSNILIGRSFATPHANGNRGGALNYGIDDGSFGGMTVYNIASSSTGYNSQFIGFSTHEGAVSAAERMRITPLGNVGIGTTAPNQRLDIRGYVVSDVNGNAVEGGFYLGGSGHGIRRAVGTNDVYLYTSSGTVYLGANGSSTNQVTILNGGNVGIGTAEPGLKLHVRGDEGQPATSGSSQNGLLRVHAGSTEGYGETLDFGVHVGASGPASYAWLQSTNWTALNINYNLALNPNGGYVSIGTGSPSNRLTVQADATGVSFADNDVAQLVLRGATNTSKRLGLGIDTVSNVGVIQAQLYGTGTYPLALNPAGGNVGIGTTSPSCGLDILGSSVASTGTLRVTNSGSGTNTIAAKFINTRGNHSFGIVAEFVTNTSGDTDRPSILFYGAQAAHSWQLGMMNTNDFHIGYRASNTPSSFGNWPSSYMVITSAGNVGVGTTAPTYKFTVYDSVNSGVVTHVYNASSGTGAYAQLAIGNNASTNGGGIALFGSGFSSSAQYRASGTYVYSNQGGGLTLHAEGANTIHLATNSLERMRITSDGNVGIGTTAPFGTTANRTCVSVNGTTDVSLNVGTGGSQRAYLYASASLGQVGTIGAIPLILATNDNEKVRITDSGNVGIGTTAPAVKLEVVGTVNAEKFRSNGVHYVGITGFKASNASAFDMFDIGNTGVHQTIEIVLSHHHSGGGQHGSFRRTILALNGYTDLVILEDVITNFGGGSGFTITRTSTSNIRIGWAGATGFSTDFYFTGWVKGNGDYTITNVGMNSLDVA